MSDTNTETKEKNANDEEIVRDKMKAHFKQWLDEHQADDKDMDMVLRAASHLTQFLESLKGDGILLDITLQSIFEEAMKDADAKLKANAAAKINIQSNAAKFDDAMRKDLLESRIPAALTSKDSVHLTVMNLPSNDLAYTNAVYINDFHLTRGNLLFPETTTHVKINDSRIFLLVKHPLVQIGCIAMSSLQRDSFDPQLPLAKLAKVSPCDITAETKVADALNIEFEPVANFRVDVDPLALIDFLRAEFKDQMVYPGTTLASNKFVKRVFKFRVTSGEGRIAESTDIYWRVSPKSKDIVNITHDRLKAEIEKEKDAALKALLNEWDVLQAQMSKVRHCFDALLKSKNQE